VRSCATIEIVAFTATALPWARDEHGIGPLLGQVGEDVGVISC